MVLLRKLMRVHFIILMTLVFVSSPVYAGKNDKSRNNSDSQEDPPTQQSLQQKQYPQLQKPDQNIEFIQPEKTAEIFQLSNEMLLEIFNKLLVPDSIRASQVCKLWRDLALAITRGRALDLSIKDKLPRKQLEHDHCVSIAKFQFSHLDFSRLTLNNVDLSVFSESLLKSLALDFCDYSGRKGRQDFFCLTTLESLSVRRSGVGVEEMQEISIISSLTRLKLEGKYVDFTGESLKNIKELNVEGNGLRGLTKYLSQLTSLTRLNLGKNELTSHCLQPLSSLTNLKDLSVSQNNIDRYYWNLSIPSLTRLNLSDNKSSRGFLEFIDNSSYFPNLIELDLSSTNLENVFVYLSPSLPYLTALTDLDLSDNRLEDSAIKEVIKIPSLSILRLNSNHLSARGVQSLVGYESLTELYLKDNPIREEAKASLKKLFFNFKVLEI